MRMTKQKTTPTTNHIDEYLISQGQTQDKLTSKELFKGDKSDIDLKTELQFREVTLICALISNDDFLVSKGIKPVYEEYINKYMRLKVSLDRKSRGEFVTMNTNQENANKTLENASNLNNILGAKK